MREKILSVIEKNSRIDIEELAILLGEDETAIANEIADMEKEGVICGYHTLINCATSLIVLPSINTVKSNEPLIRYTAFTSEN